MKTLTFEDRESWLSARKGKITGTRLKDIVVKRGTGRKIGFYELVAERVATEPDSGENALERGVRLEPEAMERFVKETKKKVNTDLVLWVRDDNDSIAISPDGFIGKTEAVETKCLSSARHIEAFLTQQIPDEYEMQTLQYFIVNDSLKKLSVVFYDPRIPCKDYFVIEINHKDVQEKVDEYLEYERGVLAEVQDIVTRLTF